MTASVRPRIAGIVLAAGAGRRFGGPKALARDREGVPWIVRAVDALRGGGCDDVVVVLGAEAPRAAALIPAGARVVVASDWAGGLSFSLTAGLDAAAAAGADAAVVVPVDTPELPASAVTRVLAAASPDPRSALVRATYGGSPGHPVLLGAEHWAGLRAELSGDIGAGPFLALHGAAAVECGDLWPGLDHDEAG